MNQPIRPAVSETDFEACFALFKILSPDLTPGEYRENVRRARSLGDKIFVYEAEGEILGVTTFSEQADPTMGPYILLSHTIVDPDHRNQKIGAALVTFVEDYARQHEFPTVRVMTLGFRVDAHAYYQKRGYHQTRLVFDREVA